MPGPLMVAKARARMFARAAATSALLGFLGLVFALVGLGCLTAALWILIALYQGTVLAFVFVGLLYLAAACLFLALATYAGRQRHVHAPYGHRPEAPGDPYVRIAEAFATGMLAGRAARRR